MFRGLPIQGGAALQRCTTHCWHGAASAAEVIMSIPYRGSTGRGTYFITSSTYQKKSILQSDLLADLFVNVLRHYRSLERYFIHEFVVMPDHFHLLITPSETLERSMQLIKGGFSFRAKKDLNLQGEVWQNSFYDRRVRDNSEYCRFREYIHQNPVSRRLVTLPEDFRYSSAAITDFLDPIPQRLKPL